MQHNQLASLSYEIELKPGEPLRLPPELTQQIGPGRWLITLQPVTAPAIRNHRAFLNSYAPEDEGLYDDYPGR